MKMKVLRLLLGAALTCASLPLFAQTSRGSVAGLVTDATGAAVPKADVELKSQTTGVARMTSTNDAGAYRFDAVDLGVYDVMVKAGGFTPHIVRGVPVRAGQAATVDAHMEVAQSATTVVEVSASAGAALQTEAPVRGGNITPVQITDLPVATRNPTDLALNLPGVVPNRSGGRGINTYIVNGGRNRSNNFLLDGTENNDISVAGQGFQLTNPDAVQEVAVQTSNFDAEFGRAGGAVINVITRSGTNNLHGTAAYTLDSTYDDAITNTQSLSADVRRRGHPLPGTEQWFAGTVGGRIIRDRTFFFGAYQDRRQNSQSSNQVNTLSARGWSTLNSLFPKGANRNIDLFRDLAEPAGASDSQFFNVPLGGGRPDLEFGSLLFPYAQTRTDRQILVRIDHQLRSNNQLSGRLTQSTDDRPVGGETTSFPGLFTGQKNKYYNALVADTHVFSPSLTNEARLSYNRIGLDFPMDPANRLGYTAPELRIQGITVLNVFAIGVTSNFPQGRTANNYVLQDTLTYIRGKHNFRFGFDLLDQRSKQFAPIPARGVLDFRASTGYSGFANFVDDFGGSGGGANKTFGDAAYYPELFRQAYFFQDRWRMSRDLTVTMGVRWEDFGTPVNSIRTAAWAGLFNIDPVTFDGPYRLPNKVKADRNNVSPTVGLAWSPSSDSGIAAKLLGNKRSVVRLGYGIGYDSFFNNIASNAQTSVPNTVATATPSTVTPALPRGLAALSSALPTTPRAASPLDSQALVPGNLVNPYYQRWSAGLQRELGASYLLDISYVGSKGTKLYLNEQLNPTVPASLQVIPSTATPIPASNLQGRRDALQGSRNIRTNGGDSNYHALQSQFTRRFSKGLFGSASYTWSKMIDNGGDVFSTTQVNQTQNPAVPAFYAGGLRFDRAVSVYDRTHRAVLSTVYNLPLAAGRKGALGHLLGGWQISTIYTIESGVPLNVTNGLDADGLDGAGDRPDFNPLGRKGVRAAPGASPTGYVNPDAGNAPIDPATAQYIALPAQSGPNPARTGNLGRNTLRTPRLNNFDVNFFKTVQVMERLKVEFRTEFFNFLNHPQYGFPSVSAFSPGAQAIAASVATSPGARFLQPQYADGGGRVVRYQLKLRF
jgi:hypothetical protein